MATRIKTVRTNSYIADSCWAMTIIIRQKKKKKKKKREGGNERRKERKKSPYNYTTTPYFY